MRRGSNEDDAAVMRLTPLAQFLLLSGGVHLSLLMAGVPAIAPLEPAANRVGISLSATLLPTAQTTALVSPPEPGRVRTAATSVHAPTSSAAPIEAMAAEASKPVPKRPSPSTPVAAAKPPHPVRRTRAQTDSTEISAPDTPAERSTELVETAAFDSQHATLDVSRDPSDAQISQWQSHLQAQLTERMQNKFRYPLLARRRGWQGVVRLRFVVTSRGQITGVELASSSGYQLLDDSALKSAEQIRELPVAFEAATTVAPLRVEIPVRFLLQG